MPDETLQHYQGERGRRYQEVKRGIPAGTFDWVARLRAEKISPHISASDVVLEYGVGMGWNLAALRCARRIGYDVADFVADDLRQRGIEFVADTRPLAAGSCDVVLCHHALEHMLRPADDLAEMRRLLKPGGRLLLFVPYEKERRYRRYRADEPNHHLHSWNVQTLANLVAECAFEIESARLVRFRFDRFAAVCARLLRVGERGYRIIRAVLLAIDPEFEVRIVARKKS
jgi:SAM-dependent methyltransferase